MNIYHALENVFIDNMAIIPKIEEALVEKLESLGSDITVEVQRSDYRKTIVIRGIGMVKISRDRDEVVIEGNGNPMLNSSSSTHIPVPGQKRWCREWNSALENKWLTVFTEQLSDEGEKILVTSSEGQTQYEFTYRGNLYYSRIKGTSSFCGGAMMFIPDQKLIVEGAEEGLIQLGNDFTIERV